MHSKINKIIFITTLLISFSHANAEPLISNTKNVVSNDPFIKDWQYFDGTRTYKMTIARSTAPDQDYSINYDFPSGHSGSDFCKITSSNSFNCQSRDSVTRDDEHYSITVSSPFVGTHVYYDPEHMPAVSPILGNWRYKGYTITVTAPADGSKDHYDVITSLSEDGDHCYYSVADPFYVTNNSDGTQLFTHQLRYGPPNAFLYDPAKNEIRNPYPGKDFKVGFCISIYSGQDQNYSFKK